MTQSEVMHNIDLRGKKVYVGLSGGVDSSVSALLLKQAGAHVTGVFIKVWQPDFVECTWKQDRLDAIRIAAALDIPFVTLDLVDTYKKEVIDYMIGEYEAGRTPNPDVMCNRFVKFGGFYDWARQEGADYVATGHYARTRGDELVTALDETKDQTYFLYTLSPEVIGHTLFPIGHLHKTEVRTLAEQYGLATAHKRDSQGLCFVGTIDMKTLIHEYVTSVRGEVRLLDEQVIGHHDGAIFLTLGERRGFTVTRKSPDDTPYYVVKKDMNTNTVYVDHHKDVLVSSRIQLVHCVLRNRTDAPLVARVRHRGAYLPVSLAEHGESIEVTGIPEAVSSGQSVVLYQGVVCVGGGIVE